MQLKLFIFYLPTGVIIISLLLFNQILMEAAAAEQTDIYLKDKAIKQELASSKTKPTKENNTVKQPEEKQESNGDTRGAAIEQNMTIDDIHASDDIPFELPFDNIIPFP
jgi:sortase (surface protein transpeptidase)